MNSRRNLIFVCVRVVLIESICTSVFGPLYLYDLDNGGRVRRKLHFLTIIHNNFVALTCYRVKMFVRDSTLQQLPI